MVPDTPDWVRDAVFYQIFPDRFARSRHSDSIPYLEDWDAPPTPHGFKGGDLHGICDRIDYLTDLGVTALYLCPIFSSASNHRYHTYDYFQVDPLLGGNDALRQLLDVCHERDIRVVLDGVFNHASRGFWPFHHVLECGGASPYRDWFHFDPDRLSGARPFQPYPADSAAEALARGVPSREAIGYSAWWNLPALPKFNTDCPQAREYLLTVAEHWIDFGIDGWRLDVPNEIDDDDFWREFRRRVRAIRPDAYIVGEIWGDATRWLHGDMWDGVMNYQATAACLGFFGGPRLDLDLVRRPSSFHHVRPLTASEFAEHIAHLLTCYPSEVTASQLNLLDSHDTPRFLTGCRGDRAALKMAWLFLCLFPGAPCIYYGDEVGLAGREDPDCRRGFPWDPDRQDQDLKQWYRQCIAWRKQLTAFRRGPLSVTVYGDHVVGLTSASDRSVAVVFNAGDDTRTVDVSASADISEPVEIPSRSAVPLGLSS